MTMFHLQGCKHFLLTFRMLYFRMILPSHESAAVGPFLTHKKSAYPILSLRALLLMFKIRFLNSLDQQGSCIQDSHGKIIQEIDVPVENTK